MEFFIWCIDVLASRYGWTKQYCEEALYWDEFFEFVKLAANNTVEERNSELKFHFMLHADKKSKSKWKDFDLPFPKDGADDVKDKSGVTGIPDNMKGYIYKED